MQPDSVRTVGVLLFDGFDLLDACGPIEVFGNLKPRFTVVLVSESAGSIASAQGPKVLADHSLNDCPPIDVLLVPGGPGARREVDNATLLAWLTERAAAKFWPEIGPLVR